MNLIMSILNQIIKIKSFLIIILVFFSFGLLYSQETSKNKIIHKIIYKGIKRAKKKDIQPLILSKEGTVLDLLLVEEDYQRLIGSGNFEDVSISTDKAIDEQTKAPIENMVNLTFNFIEKPVIRKIIFRGNKKVSYGMLIDVITIKVGEFLDLTKVNSDINAITEKYKKKGFNYVKINYEVFQDDQMKENSRIDLIFKVEEGVETYVQEIILNGNATISDITLKNKMKTKERKYLGLQKGVFVESDFHQDIEDLKKYYKDLGYFLVEIQDPEITYYQIEENAQKKEVIRIKIFIKENEQYRFGGIKINGNKLFSTDDLLYNMKIKIGQLFNYSRYQESLYTLQKIYTDHGYIQTQITDSTDIDKENKTITVVLDINESKRSYIEAIFFKGNDKTKNYVLERSIFTEVGEIFNSSKMMDSIMSLYNLGFFTNVQYDIQPGTAPGLLKITYILDETKTAEVKFGLSIPVGSNPNSNIPELTLFAEVDEKDFVGREINLGGKVEGSLYKQGFSLNIDDPWFYNYPWSLGASIKFYHDWTRLVYRKLTQKDFDDYEQAAGTTGTETDVRNYYNNSTTDDTANQNYLNYGNGFLNMGLHDLTWDFAVNSGYRFLRYYSVGGGISCDPIYTWLPAGNGSRYDIYYDAYFNAISFNPNDPNASWSVKNKIFASFQINTTKRKVNPYDGFTWSTTTSYTFGDYDSVFLNTKFTYYFPILDVSFNDYPFKNVLVFNIDTSFILPGFRNIGGEFRGYTPADGHPLGTYGAGPILYYTDFLTVDGIFSGRGWANSLAGTNYLGNQLGYVKLSGTIEYRVPIYDKIIWVAGFIDAINIITGPYNNYIDPSGNLFQDTTNSWAWWSSSNGKNVYSPYQPLGIDNWYFSIGGGIQITFPQLPLSFYVAKRFKINYYSGIVWQDNKVGGVDFILSMVGMYF